MSKISHQHAKSLIQATMGGSVTVPEKENLAQHLETCAYCCEYASQMDALEDNLHRCLHTRWDSTRGPSPFVVETIYNKTRNNLMHKKFFGLASTAIVIGVLAVITFFAISILSRENTPLSAGQITPTQAPTDETPLVTEIFTKTVTSAITTPEPRQVNCALRTQTISYTVQSGDTIVEIADYYCLNPATIYWANITLLRNNHNTLMPGIALDVPVDDGEYVWALPSYGQDKPESAGQVGSGACQNSATDFTGTGTFIWPTKLHFISGEDYAPDIYQFGIDLAGSSGDPVYASDRGVVVFAGWSEWGYGYMVVIDHGGGKQTVYAYLSTVGVACGEQIEQGSLIGKIGATGNATGPALHFEMIVNNEYVNPHEYLPSP
jgi:hypothetical protein